MRSFTWIFILFLFFDAQSQRFLPTLEKFGKNRIQYHSFKWKRLNSANFEIFFYGDYQKTAESLLKIADAELIRLSGTMQYAPYRKVKVFLFHSNEDLIQSNIGLNGEESTDLVQKNLSEGRLMLAFEGNWVKFQEKLSNDLSYLLIQEILYRGSLKEAIQNALLLNLPQWFATGLSHYLVKGQTQEIQDYGFHRYKSIPIWADLEKLSSTEALLMGHSIWAYVSKKYGQEKISNILSLVRITRDYRSSISNSLGVSEAMFWTGYQQYYSKPNESIRPISPNEILFQTPIESQKMNNVRMSLDRKWAAWSISQDNTNSVQVYSFQRKKIVSLNFSFLRKITEANIAQTPNAPFIGWLKNSNLAVLSKKNKGYILDIFHLNDTNLSHTIVATHILDFQEITGFDISKDGTTLALTVSRKEKSDVILYKLKSKNYTLITDDMADERNPRFIGNSSLQISFESNRTRKDKSIFSFFTHSGFKGDSAKKVYEFPQSTHGGFASPNEDYFLINTENEGFIKIDSGRKAMRLQKFDALISTFDFHPSTHSLLFSKRYKNTNIIGFKPNFSLDAESLDLIPKNTTLPVHSIISQRKLSHLKSNEIDTDAYEFSNETLKKWGISDSMKKNQTQGNKLISRKVRPSSASKITYLPNKWTIKQTDISAIIDPIRNFGLVGELSLGDLLENHWLHGSLFIPIALRGGDMTIEYKYLPHRVDFGVKVERKSSYLDFSNVSINYVLNRGTVSASYPFNQYLRGTVGGLFAQATLRESTELTNLPEISKNYFGGISELIFDNTNALAFTLSPTKGFRAKLSYEYYHNENVKESFDKWRLDARHYLRLSSNLTLASRISYGQSGGGSPKQTLVGGVDNSWSSNLNNYTTELQFANHPLYAGNNLGNIDLVFIDFATNLRGFKPGTWYGPNHFIFNTELRYSLRNIAPSEDSFLNKVNTIAFFDLGSAWVGSDPFGQNSINTEYYGGGTNPFSAIVNNFRLPYLVSFGVGVRAQILGQILQLNIACPSDNRRFTAPNLTVSFGRDF